MRLCIVFMEMATKSGGKWRRRRDVSDLCRVIKNVRSFLSELSQLIAIPRPMSPLSPLTTQISSLVASPVHPALFPLPRFAVLHAVRVALVWATLTKNTRRHKQHAGGRMQDLFGYLVMGCKRVPPGGSHSNSNGHRAEKQKLTAVQGRETPRCRSSSLSLPRGSSPRPRGWCTRWCTCCSSLPAFLRGQSIMYQRCS